MEQTFAFARETACSVWHHTSTLCITNAWAQIGFWTKAELASFTLWNVQRHHVIADSKVSHSITNTLDDSTTCGSNWTQIFLFLLLYLLLLLFFVADIIIKISCLHDPTLLGKCLLDPSHPRYKHRYGTRRWQQPWCALHQPLVVLLQLFQSTMAP